jgi:hypothetical protein
MISHIVLFEPKPDLATDKILSFAQQLARVIASVPTIRRVTVGRSLAVDSGVARNFGGKTYSFAAVIEFDDKEGLISYLNHPSHQVLGRLFWENCEATVVAEMESIDPRTSDLVDFLVNTQN